MSDKDSTDNHYVNNKEFYAEISEWKERVVEADKMGEERPQIPDSVALKIMKIAHRMSYKPNFINYTYRDDMISDGIENGLRYAHNFNPEKTSNPFAYFSQIIYNAFVQRITKEKRQFDVKAKVAQNLVTIDQMEGGGTVSDTQEHDGDEDFDNGALDHLQAYFEHDLEEAEARRSRKNKKTKDDSSNPQDLSNYMKEEDK